jgi:hypothetical protein
MADFQVKNFASIQAWLLTIFPKIAAGRRGNASWPTILPAGAKKRFAPLFHRCRLFLSIFLRENH